MASHGVPRGPATHTDEQKRQDREKIQKYRHLENQLRDSKGHGTDVFQLTTRLLRLNPEYYTVWNVRRRCLISGGLLSLERINGVACQDGQTEATAVAEAEAAAISADAEILRDELQFTIPLLMEFPKCYWIWSFRLWVLQQAVLRLDVLTARSIWEDELALDSKMLTLDRRNFHAWGYRRQVVEQLESKALAVANKGDPEATPAPTSLVEPEFAYTTKMIHMDLSNFSAWHNRSKLIPRLLDERNSDALARKQFLDTELGIIREALNVGPEDQSLWFYHQFLMLNLTDYTGRPTITPQFSLEERMTYAVREVDDIKDLMEDYDDVKWIYEALLEYTIAIAKMNERPLNEEELEEARLWLARLRKLDPMRSGRWDDLETEHIFRRRRPSYARGISP